MSSALVVPFNFQPSGTPTITASTTIAAGKYAYCVPTTPACTVGGTEIFMTTQTAFNASMTATSFFAIPPGFTGKIVTSAASATKSLNGIVRDSANALAAVLVTSVATTSVLTVYFDNGIPLNSTGQPFHTANNVVLGYQVTTTANITLTATIAKPTPLWLPAGAVLAGGSWIVTEYNQIT